MSFAQAVREGVMVEPSGGEPEMPSLLADLDALGVPLMAIVEHDLYPTPPDVPLPITTRTQSYYSSCGLRTA
jgi:inosose dehydratase